ncbi:MAG TPA: PilZ domain-containing protein [Nitrospiraceae bacterium]|nr:PilZ domain-containing protein [Nitrospiraceae bacterium]
MKQPVKSKRRKIGSARFEVKMDVQFLGLTPEGLEIEGIGVVRNLSMRGALIETRAYVTPADQLTLFVTLPNQADLLEIPAVAVRWVVRRHQLGVEFLKLDRKTSLQLMRYLSDIYNTTRAQRKAV